MWFGAGARTLVGRAREQERLRSWLAGLSRAAEHPLDAPAASVAVIEGEAGAGKSALVADLMAGWVEHGGWVLGGGGVAIPGLQALQSPYGVFVEAVRGVQRLPGVPPALVEEARAWVAPSQRVGELMDPATVRQEALLGLVHRLAGIAPLVIVVEDLHWADPASLSSLVFLTRHVGDAPVSLLVASRRPGDVRPTPPVRGTAGVAQDG